MGQLRPLLITMATVMVVTCTTPEMTERFAVTDTGIRKEIGFSGPSRKSRKGPTPCKAVADPSGNIAERTNGLLLACEDGDQLPGFPVESVRGTGLFSLGREGRREKWAKMRSCLTGRFPADRRSTLGCHSDAEWVGAIYWPNGATLFVNFYVQGSTFVVNGPQNTLSVGSAEDLGPVARLISHERGMRTQVGLVGALARQVRDARRKLPRHFSYLALFRRTT